MILARIAAALWGPGGAAAVLLLGAPLAAAAQETGPGADAGRVPQLELTDAQKHTIYISVTNQNIRNAAPPDFQPAVGATVPQSVELEDMPRSIVELAPAAKGFQIARIINQVVIVEPQSRRIVEVISGKSL